MATKKKPPAAPMGAVAAGGFDAWRSARRGADVDDAIRWREAYRKAIDEKSATAEVMALLFDGQSEKRSLWKFLKGPDDDPFTSFAAFTAAEPPFGLGVPVDDLRRLRRVLRFNGATDEDRAAGKRGTRKK